VFNLGFIYGKNPPLFPEDPPQFPSNIRQKTVSHFPFDFQLSAVKLKKLMSDPTPAPTPTPTPQTSKRTRSPVNKHLVAELDLAERLIAVAQKSDYADKLADEEIDDTFLTALTGKITQADPLLGSVTGDTADKENSTLDEDTAKKALVAQIEKAQKRAKRKYGAKDPARGKYFIGQRIETNRAMLEGAAKAIEQTLATDTLPGHKAADTTALTNARMAYTASKPAQAGEQSKAASDRIQLEALVKDIADGRRQIQYAADTLWPASDKANAAIRREFGLPPNRSLK